MEQLDVETGIAAVLMDRSEGEQSSEYLPRLHHLSLQLSQALTSEQVADVLLFEGLSALNAAAGSVCQLTGEGAYLETVRAFGYPPQFAQQGERFSCDAPTPLAEAARNRVSIFLNSAAEGEAPSPAVVGVHESPSEQGALAAVPLQIQDRVLGVIGVAFPQNCAPGAEF